MATPSDPLPSNSEPIIVGSTAVTSTDANSLNFEENPKPPSSSDEDFFSSVSSEEHLNQNSSSNIQVKPDPQIPILWPSDGHLTIDWVMTMMEVFDWSSRNLLPTELPTVLPVQVFDSLVLTASKLLHKEPNCVKIDDCGDDMSIVVVGDVHGQLHDVLFLLRNAGFPSENRIFVFNGDYVDRGAWGLETFVLLLAWKILFPNRVYLLRGNHESKYCTSVYGFEAEVLAKYGEKGKHVYRKCLGCFEGLPLASIIAGNVYTAHGGVFRAAPVFTSKRSKGKKNRKLIVASPGPPPLILGSLEELLKARRSVLDPPWEGSNLIPGDILWSDPSMSPGLSPNKERGIGLLWGPDCTEEFLRKFNLKLIIRSHEGPDAREKRSGLGGMDEGYTIDHTVESGKLITLFSAPDYPQFQATKDRYKNKGAYIVLKPPDFATPEFHSFQAVTPRPKVNPYYDFEYVIDSDEELDLASMVPSTSVIE
ncbi:serine/threonine-protein phosphatase 7 [Impatiens glandulifera]|uniref:serine/threonine-protein phosphatase 7 n=1 Tax=Impatiens glandulifera TaxID=253017 RepID=UPI001FB14676|nr:serine/threonine-protein phosphatase 7 [Impatiens glandulifera]